MTPGMSIFPGRSHGIAAASAAVVGFFVAAVFPRATWPLIDGDVWWHIRAGEEVVRLDRSASRHLEHRRRGTGWTSQDWLAT